MTTSCRYFSILCISLGVLLILLLGSTHISMAQDSGDEYFGSSECRSCHDEQGDTLSMAAHTLTMQEASDEGAIIADFGTGEEVRMVQFPDEDAPRPFTAEDVTYTVGAGRYVQRYLYEVDFDTYGYRVFPAEWNVMTGEWQALTLADNWDDPAYDWTTQCAGCHTTGARLEPDGYVSWLEEGVQCEACHGPGAAHLDALDEIGFSDLSDEELAQVRASIPLTPDAQVCGQCHARGTNGDFAYPLDYIPGEDLTESFTLSEPGDPVHWWTDSIGMRANMQYNEWLHGGHAGALDYIKDSDAADETCLACHSGDAALNAALTAAHESGEREGLPPDAVTVDSAQYGVTCVNCHFGHASEIGNTLREEPYALCTSCHQNTPEGIHHPVQEIFEGQPLVEGISADASSHFSSEEGADCIACHMTAVPIEDGTVRATHSMQPIIPGADNPIPVDSCTSCHSDLSPDYLGEFVSDAQAKTQTRLDAVQVALTEAEAPAEWVLAAVAAVEGDGSSGVHNVAYINALLNAVEIELGIAASVTGDIVAAHPATDPSECAECHTEEHTMWAASPHANASLNDQFLQAYAEENRPAYCMSCHASGYDINTATYQFEGVVCSTCHTPTTGSEHPPAPLDIGDSSALCGQCHSGAHAPTYDEWLVSDHREAGVDCIDCHTPHNNGLIMGDVNSTCGDCHQDAMQDEVHMGEDMTCVDCHMSHPDQNEPGTALVFTGHTMQIDPGTCAECHGNVHQLVATGDSLTERPTVEIAALETEIDDLQEEVDSSRNTGLVGGALGTLIVLLVAFILFRVRALLS